MKHDNTRVISLIMVYDNIKSLIFKLFGVSIYCLLENIFLLDMCVYKCKQTVSVTQRMWRYFVWWAFRNSHSWNVLKHCVLLYFCSRRHFNTNFDVQKQVIVILHIQRLCGGFTQFLSSKEFLINSQTTHTLF